MVTICWLLFSIFVILCLFCYIYSFFYFSRFHRKIITYSICLCLTYFTKNNTIWVHLCCCKWQNFILFYGWVKFSSVQLSRSVVSDSLRPHESQHARPPCPYGCESWTVKKAEHRKIDAFELWCWRRLLRVPWTARRSNQSILKEISPGCSLKGLRLKLKFQYFGHLMQRVDSLEKTLMLGGIGGRRRRGWQRMSKIKLYIYVIHIIYTYSIIYIYIIEYVYNATSLSCHLLTNT